jgi:hypothetical protein
MKKYNILTQVVEQHCYFCLIFFELFQIKLLQLKVWYHQVFYVSYWTVLIVLPYVVPFLSFTPINFCFFYFYPKKILCISWKGLRTRDLFRPTNWSIGFSVFSHRIKFTDHIAISQALKSFLASQSILIYLVILASHILYLFVFCLFVL